MDRAQGPERLIETWSTVLEPEERPAPRRTDRASVGVPVPRPLVRARGVGVGGRTLGLVLRARGSPG